MKIYYQLREPDLIALATYLIVIPKSEVEPDDLGRFLAEARTNATPDEARRLAEADPARSAETG